MIAAVGGVMILSNLIKHGAARSTTNSFAIPTLHWPLRVSRLLSIRDSSRLEHREMMPELLEQLVCVVMLRKRLAEERVRRKRRGSVGRGEGVRVDGQGCDEERSVGI